MKRKDMNRKDKTAQMIGQVIQPVDQRASYPVTTDVIEPRAVSKASKDSYQRTLLQTTLNRELGLNLGMPMVSQGGGISGGGISGGGISGGDIGIDFGADVEPDTEPDTEPDVSEGPVDSWDTLPTPQSPRYRITKLLSQSIGKRTFLGIEERSQSQVVIQLLLFCPDTAAEEASLAEHQDALPPYALPTHLPYIESFEAVTPLGEGLVLIKSFAEAPPLSTQSAVQQPASNLSPAASTSPSPQGRRFSDVPVQPHTSLRVQSSAVSPIAVPTAHPQHSYGAMRIRMTPQKLQVQFPEWYVRSGLSTSIHQRKTSTEVVEMWLLTVLGTVIFVGGTVASTGSVLAGVVVAGLLPILYRLLVGAPAPKRRRTAHLRITSEPDGRAFVSLTSMGRPTRDRTGRVNGPPTESQLHGSWLSIKSVKVSPTFALSSGVNPFRAKLTFSFHNQNWHSQSLQIVGSYEEIRWLSHHLAKWGHAHSQC